MKLCTFPQIQFNYVWVFLKICVLDLLSILFMLFSQEDQCNAFQDAVYSCIYVNDYESFGPAKYAVLCPFGWPYVALSIIIGI